MKRPKLKSLTLIGISVFFLSAIGLEVGGRLVGAVDLVLTKSDPDFEYCYAPNQDCHIFGKHVQINDFSMRSPPVKPGGPRVLVVGDSIIWGGTQVDQSDIATSRLARQISDGAKKNAQVLNVSAGSWGPPNQLAYLKKFGDFDADAAILVISTHDADDAMTFQTAFDVDQNFPTQAPKSALWTMITRYAPKLVHQLHGAPEPATSYTPVSTTRIEKAVNPAVMGDLQRLLEILGRDGRPVIVVLHREEEELNLDGGPAFMAIKAAAEKAGAKFIDTRPYYRRAIEQGQPPYRDWTHLTTSGQAVLGDIFFDALKDLKAFSPEVPSP